MNDRDHSLPEEALSFGPFSLFVTGRQLKRADEQVPLGGRAFDLLITLAKRAGEVVSYNELISSAWPNVTVYDGNLRVQILTLRKALNDGEDGARYISNVAGRGYCFVAPVSRSATRPTAAGGTADYNLLGKLPPRLTRVVGRDEVVRTVSERLNIGRFVSIVGPGGIGKTTVAISVAHSLLKGFHGAVFFIDLGTLTSPRLVPTAVGSTLGFMVQAHDPFGSLVTFLRDKKLLLVLDNCEHVIDSASELAQRLVNETTQAHILTTSREALRVEGEHVQLLYSLDAPPAQADSTAAEALRYPAVQLFMERAAAAGLGTALSDGDAPIVASICRRLDGIALAIELAASRAGSLGIRGIAELLDNRFSLLWHGRRTGLPRHQTMNAMLDWSFNLLPEEERAVISKLSVFVGNFTIEAACSVVSETEADETRSTEALESLITKSLISTTQVSDSTYYRLLDTTRAFARTKLAERGETDRIARRHAEYFSRLLQGDEIARSRIGQDFSAYAQHIGNVHAMLEWALLDRGDPAFGATLVAQAAPLLLGLSLLEECRNFCERALDALKDSSVDARTEMILQEALGLSSMYTRGHGSSARAAIERGLALAEMLDDKSRQLQLLASLNLFLVRQGDVRGAQAVVERGRSVAQAIADPAGLVWAEWMTGVSHYMRGDQALAQFHLEEGMALDAEVGSQHARNYFGSVNRIGATVALARVLWLHGFPDRAQRTAQMAIDEMSRGRNHPVSVCTSLLYGGSVIFWTGNFSRAGELAEQLILYAERHSLRPYRAGGLGLKGELQVANDQTQAGIESLREALEIMNAEQYHVIRTSVMGALAEGLRKVGQLEEALFTIDGAIASATHTGSEFDVPELLHIKGKILATRKDCESATTCLKASIAKARAQHALSFELRSTMTLARLLREGGEDTEARTCVAAIYDLFTEGFDTLDLKSARAMITQVP